MAHNDITKNTVSGDNQMILSSDLSFLGREEAPLRILVLGNSITRHGPNAEIGWPYDWGMAASAPEKDYVHRLYHMLTEAGHDVYMRIRQASYWERHFTEGDVLSRYSDDRDFGADIIVFRLGENVSKERVGDFDAHLGELLSYLCERGGRAILTTCFWPYEGLDDGIRRVATARGDVLVELNPLSRDERTMALGLFEHSGVAMHPGDYGMQCIAEKLAATILALR